MTTPTDLIERLAKEASKIADWKDDGEQINLADSKQLAKFAQLVAKHCMRVCIGMGDGPVGVGYDGKDYADAIRKEFGIEPSKDDDDKAVESLVLLKLPPQTKPVYFVIRYPRFGEANTEIREYFFNEHSCPTNWLRDIEAVVIGDDTDPHGLLRYVREVDVADAVTENENIMPLATFPEMLKDDDEEAAT